MRIARVVSVSIAAGVLLAQGIVSAQTIPQAPSMTSRSSPARSVEAGGPPLALEDAIREALTGNAELTAARRQVDPLRTRPAQAGVLPPPMLEAQIWQWPINTLNPANTGMYMFMASQELPGRGKRAAGTALAETEIRVAESLVAPREREIVASVTRTYWDLLIARRTIAIYGASVDLLKELTDVAQAKYAAGRSSQQDVLKAVVETTKLHDGLIGVELQAETARLRLNALMNRATEAPIGALPDPGESILVAPASDLQALAVQQQPELEVARAQIQHARAQAVVARSASTPDWSIGAGYMLQPHQTDAWLGRISVTWPRAPWSRATIGARAAEAAATVSAAEDDAAASEVRTRLAVSDAYVRVKAAEERAALIRTTLVPQSRQALDASRVAYQTDRLDFLAVIENERTLIDAQLTYDRALTEWRQAMADLERAVGTRVPDAMLRHNPSSEAR
jgi:outer membrane protein TolC